MVDLPVDNRRLLIDSFIYDHRSAPPIEQLETITGLEYITGADGIHEKDCAWYVFHDQSWYGTNAALMNLLRTEPHRLLQNLGYVEITDLSDATILRYDTKNGGHGHWAKQDDQGITSKFGNGGPVFRHAVDCVPSCYGDEVRYFALLVSSDA
jgi:hypothetical protein